MSENRTPDASRALREKAENLVDFTRMVLGLYPWAFGEARRRRLEVLAVATERALRGNAVELEAAVATIDCETDDLPPIVVRLLGLRGAIRIRIAPIWPPFAARLEQELEQLEGRLASGDDEPASGEVENSLRALERIAGPPVVTKQIPELQLGKGVNATLDQRLADARRLTSGSIPRRTSLRPTRQPGPPGRSMNAMIMAAPGHGGGDAGRRDPSVAARLVAAGRPAGPLSVDELARGHAAARPVAAGRPAGHPFTKPGDHGIPLEAVDGVAEPYADKLRDAGVTTLEALTRAVHDPAGRESLARSTGIPAGFLAAWADHAGLALLPGVGPDYADLLAAAGVGSVGDLARRNPARLHAELRAFNEAHGIVPACPGEGQVAAWIAQAKGDREPASSPVAGAADEVDCSVFAPPACHPGDAVFVQVFAHQPEQADRAAALATEFDEDAARRGVRSLQAPVPRGGTLLFDLSFRDLEVPDPIQTLVWQGRPDSVQFEVPVPRARQPGTVVGTVSVSLDSIPVGHVRFKLEVASAGREAARAVGDDAHRYTRAFISYASPDRGEVLRRTQMLAPLGIRYFQDVLDLEPGERWERMLYRQIDECDLFLLFWSSAANVSPWVRKEVDYALARKAGDDDAPPEIRPIILEGPPIVPPWEELAHLHFNDRLVWLIGPETARDGPRP